MYTYCFFCETGKCQSVANAVMQKTPCRVILPKQVQHTWSKGKMADIVHNLLPGYMLLNLVFRSSFSQNKLAQLSVARKPADFAQTEEVDDSGNTLEENHEP